MIFQPSAFAETYEELLNKLAGAQERYVQINQACEQKAQQVASLQAQVNQSNGVLEAARQAQSVAENSRSYWEQVRSNAEDTLFENESELADLEEQLMYMLYEEWDCQMEIEDYEAEKAVWEGRSREVGDLIDEANKAVEEANAERWCENSCDPYENCGECPGCEEITPEDLGYDLASYNEALEDIGSNIDYYDGLISQVNEFLSAMEGEKSQLESQRSTCESAISQANTDLDSANENIAIADGVNVAAAEANLAAAENARNAAQNEYAGLLTQRAQVLAEIHDYEQQLLNHPDAP